MHIAKTEAIPKAVEIINDGAFKNCSGLVAVTLGSGLREIGKEAFQTCTMLERIIIPSNVKEIDDSAFNDHSNLTNVEFCDEIEEFVSCEAMRDWWHQGLHEKSLSTYCFLVQYDIPKRSGLVRARKWRANIYDKLRSIPTISAEGVHDYFNTIDVKLTVYENLKDSPASLELAIWKTKITEQVEFNGILTTEMKMQLRIDSIAMVSIIIPNVLSFLTDGEGSN
jgi:hypothetical protein